MTAPAPEVLRFDHVGASVADLDRSARFYGDVLGFTTVEHAFTLPGHDIRGVVLINPAGVRVELFERQGSVPGRAGHPTEGALTRGWFQFGLAVTDLRATYARVVAAGATPVFEPRVAPDGKTLFAFVGDPDGNLVELLQRTAE